MPFRDDEPVVVRQVGDDRWMLIEPITYDGTRESFVVPAGFKTDFASTPKPLTWFLPRYGRHTKAAILHDFLWKEAQAGRFTRYDADGIFRRSMRELGVPFCRRWMMWGAVRLAAWKQPDRDTLQLGLKPVLLVLLVALPSLVFLTLPTLVILAWMVLFWVVETVFFFALKPTSRHKEVNPPRFLGRPAVAQPRAADTRPELVTAR